MFLIISILAISYFILNNIGNKFDKKLWLKRVDVRSKMIYDLTKNHLRNKNKNELIAMLGEPNKKYFKSVDLVYNLGMESGLISMDCQWLLIYLDSNKQYKFYKLKTD